MRGNKHTQNPKETANERKDHTDHYLARPAPQGRDGTDKSSSLGLIYSRYYGYICPAYDKRNFLEMDELPDNLKAEIEALDSFDARSETAFDPVRAADRKAVLDVRLGARVAHIDEEPTRAVAPLAGLGPDYCRRQSAHRRHQGQAGDRESPRPRLIDRVEDLPAIGSDCAAARFYAWRFPIPTGKRKL